MSNPAFNLALIVLFNAHGQQFPRIPQHVVFYNSQEQNAFTSFQSEMMSASMNDSLTVRNQCLSCFENIKQAKNISQTTTTPQNNSWFGGFKSTGD